MFNIHNHTCLIGTLETDPVIEKDSEGAVTANFTLGCRDNFLNRDGEPGVQYLPIVRSVPGDDEETIAAVKALRKGMLLGIGAQLASSAWTDSEGYVHKDLKIIADTIDVMPDAE